MDNLLRIAKTALEAAQDELSTIADGQPDLVSDEVLSKIALALELITKKIG